MKQYYRKINLSQLELNEGQLEGLPKNPRFIKDEKFNDLTRSIEQSPEFLEARPLLVYQYAKGRYVTIAGNMRLRACRALKLTDAPCCFHVPEATETRCAIGALGSQLCRCRHEAFRYHLSGNELDLCRNEHEECQGW